MRRSLLIILLAFFCLGMTFRPAKPSLIKGRVVDAKTNQFIAGALVRISSITGKIAVSISTDTSGNYNLSKPLGGYYFVDCLAKGYNSSSLLRYLKPETTYTFDFRLKPIPPINYAPVIKSITPIDDSTFLAGAKIGIKINASDLENDPLEYQFSIGGAIKQPWFSSSTYSWQTSEADTGSVEIACEVKDSKGARAAKTIVYRIINPTVEQILQKVADNYAKIYDFKADMILSSTLNGQPFGETEYCRYYFKAPNKEKTETYSESSRTTKTDIIIINGSDMHLINPVHNIKQTVDLLADAGINSIQFSQMDLYYNQSLFLSQNTVSKNDSDSVLNNMFVALDIVPNIPNNIYDKLSISIDYPKGVVNKYSIYRKDTLGQLELVQETKAIESQKMPNAAWLPTKMTKTPNLTSGNLISVLTYDNLQINTGLTDSDFDPNRQGG